ncbi:hypothetical protein [Nocardia cerradoensis]|uniref:Transmembrane protein n=1 Tax=Nocardia cerradoensis TaxID=85688 RepID=A0A231H4D3_9NOCA|nr:hypothetical protein [Nocardia cerradoensis]NKY42506.1 hypothetical protein [Nocardia cerradoensis]OXR43680.1 hypothetical protein B7C42_04548 [Nocardia cerradoensis]
MKTFVKLWAFVTAALLLIVAGLVWMIWALGDLLPPSWSWVRWLAPLGLFPLLFVASTGWAWRSARDGAAIRPDGNVYGELIVGGVATGAFGVLASGVAALFSGLEYLSKRRLSNAGGPLCGSDTMIAGDRCVQIPGGRVHQYGELAGQYWSASWQAHLAGNYFWVSVAVAVVSLALLVVTFFKL